MAVTWKKLAYTDSPTFTGTITTPAIKITTGAGTGKVLTSDPDGDATWETASGGSSRWTAITAFNDDPPSSSTITMTSDLTSTIKIGMPIKFVLGGDATNPGTYYAICTAITSNLLTIAGAPLEVDDGDLTGLYYGTPEMVVTETFVIPGYFADASDTTLLANDLLMEYRWNYAKAYCVRFSLIAKTDDSGANQPQVNIDINGANSISTSNSNAGLAVSDADWVTTVVDINTSNYDINPLETLEIRTDANGTTDDASNLTVQITFVLE